MSRPYRQQSRSKEAERLSGIVSNPVLDLIDELAVLSEKRTRWLLKAGPIAHRLNQESEHDR